MRYNLFAMRPVKKILLAIFLLLAAFIAYGVFEARGIRVNATRFSGRDVPAAFSQKKIVFASDFHCGIFFDEKRMIQTVDAINAQTPDIVILGGDYVDYDKRYIPSCIGALKNIRAKYGVYGILGNHDYMVGVAAVKNALKNASVAVLDNRGVWIEGGGSRIRIGGVDDYIRGHAVLEPVLAETNESDLVVLAAHNPAFVKNITNNGIDLVLSGHTHGGQVTFFGLWAPFFHFKYGQRYRASVFEAANATVIVSNGVGTTYVPIRFFAEPEINVIELENEL